MIRLFARASPVIAALLLVVVLVEPPAIRPSDRVPTLRVLMAPWPPPTRSALTIEEVRAAIEWGTTAEPRPYLLHALGPPGPDGVRATGGYAGAVYTPFVRVAFAARAARRQGRAIGVHDIPAWLTAPVADIALGFGSAPPGRETLPKEATVAVVPRSMAVSCREPPSTLFDPVSLTHDGSLLERFGAEVPVENLAWVATYPLEALRTDLAFVACRWVDLGAAGWTTQESRGGIAPKDLKYWR
jgi:hypothetical protein